MQRRVVSIVSSWVGWPMLRIAQGVLEYAKEHTQWRVRAYSEAEAASIQAAAPDAIVSIAIREQANAQLLQQVRWWVAVVAEEPSGAEIVVDPDDREIGRQAAMHLLSKGLTRFAYYGAHDHWSKKREAGFSEVLQSKGFTVQSNLTAPGSPETVAWPEMERPDVLAQWIGQLRPPIGIFACQDAVASAVAAACESAGLRLPEDAAIMGVNNDRGLCEWAPIPLTSVDPDWELLGREAAAQLDQAMQPGRPAMQRRTVVPPREVVVRQSTDLRCVPDPDIQVALEFLRANVARPITADELQNAVGTSLRTIQIKFQRVLGRSPWDELRRLRLDHAAELLRTTNMKVEAVALRCGFDYLSHFSRAFAQWQGVAPSQYRLRHRTAG